MFTLDPTALDYTISSKSCYPVSITTNVVDGLLENDKYSNLIALPLRKTGLYQTV